MRRILFPALALILALGLALVLMVAPTHAESASVWTDKQDYAPGDTVTIFGSDFLANAEVAVTVERPDGVMDTVAPAPVTDDTGYFTCSYQLDGITGTYTVTATDGDNTATTTFTDADIGTVSVSPATRTVAAGASTTYTVTVTKVGGSTLSVTFTVVGSLPTGASANFSPNPVTFLSSESDPKTSTLTITTSASGSTGTFTFKVRGTKTGTGNYAESSNVTLNVTGGETTPPLVNVAFPPPDGLNGWFVTSPVVGTVTATDPSNVTAINVTGAALSDVTGLGTTSASGTLTVSGEGIHNIVANATDGQGNSGAAPGSNNTATVKIDTVAPTLEKVLSGTLGLNGWYTSNVIVNLTGADATSGLNRVEYNLNGGGWTTYTANFTISTEGSNTLQHRAYDNAGNEYVLPNQTIKIDKTAPTLEKVLSGTLGLNGWYTSDVTVNLTGADATSGLNRVEYNLNGGGWTTYTANFTISTEGSNTLQHRAYDNAGNEYVLPNQTIKINKTAPTGSITIHCGLCCPSTYTSTVSVTLNLAATDAVGVTGYRVADGTDASGASTIAISSTTSFSADIPWTLPSGDGTKTVAVQYRNAVGNWSPNYTDSIILDTTPPTGSITINGGAPYTNSTGVTLNLAATDAVGVTGYRVADGTDASHGIIVSVPWTTSFHDNIPWTLPSGDGTKTVAVQYRDAAGNWSPNYTDSIILDTTPPTGSITINGGAPYTNSTSVTLNLAATDAEGVTGYRVADGSDASGASTVPVSSTTSFSADIPWTLPSGDGTKTVAVQYRDAAGNWSPNYTDNIILDTTPPTDSITINGGAPYTNSTSVTLNIAATDAEGVTGYRVADGTDASGGTIVTVPSTTSFSADIPWTLPSGDGTKTVAVQYRDAAGSWSPNYTDSIILDTTAPVVSINAPADDGYYQTDTLPALDYTVSDNLDPSPGVVVSGWSTDKGVHTVTVTATDAAGNVGSASITYNVLTVINWALIGGIIAAALAAGFIFWFFAVRRRTRRQSSQ